LTSSGMSSISAVFHGIFTHTKFAKKNLVYSNELYCDSPRLFEYFRTSYDTLSTVTIDVNNPTEVVKLFSSSALHGRDNILFIESCSNPNGFVFDFSIIPQLRKLSKDLLVIVDNTWLTDAVFNPFTVCDVDIVLTSLTKYYGGGTAIAGAIITSTSIPTLSEAIFNWLRITGQHVSPHNCKLIASNVHTVQDRIESSSQLTLKVAQYLETHPSVLSVSYPLLKSHPTYSLALKYFNPSTKPTTTTDVNTNTNTNKAMNSNSTTKSSSNRNGRVNEAGNKRNGNNSSNNKKSVVKKEEDSSKAGDCEVLGPSVLTFVVKGTKTQVLKVLKNAKIIEHKTSFGCRKTRTDPWPKAIGDSVMVRLAIGFDDDYTRVVKGLDEILSKI